MSAAVRSFFLSPLSHEQLLNNAVIGCCDWLFLLARLTGLKPDNNINTFTCTDFISGGLRLQVLPLILPQSQDAFFHLP